MTHPLLALVLAPRYRFSHQAAMNGAHPVGTEAWLQAIAAGEVDAVQALLAGDPGLLDVAPAGYPGAVLWAMYHRQPAMAELLAAHKRILAPEELVVLGRERDLLAWLSATPGGADWRSADGFPLLGLAVYFDRMRCAALLLGAGASPDAAAAEPMRVAPIHAAAAQADEARALALTRLLLAFGADPDRAQQKGFRALHAAAHRDHARLAATLLAAGADPLLCNDDGQTARDIALEEGKPTVLAVLPSG